MIDISNRAVAVVRKGRQIVIPAADVESGDYLFRYAFGGFIIEEVSDGFLEDGDSDECFICTRPCDALDVTLFASAFDEIPAKQIEDAVKRG